MSIHFGDLQFRVHNNVQALSCPCCGAPLETSSKECGYCRTPLVITSGRVAFDDDLDPEDDDFDEDDDVEDEDEPEENYRHTL